MTRVVPLLLLSSLAAGDATPPAPRDAGPRPEPGHCLRDNDCACEDPCSPKGHQCMPRASLARPDPTCRRNPDVGDECRCVARKCTREFTQPVSCRTWRDCSELDGKPAPARFVPRARGKVHPCKDGESDVICNRAHVCERVAWPC